MTVWVVRYSNYEPAEIVAICATESAAQRIRATLSKLDPWEVEEWSVEE